MFKSPTKFFKSIIILFLVQVGTIIGLFLLVFPGMWFAYTFSQALTVFIDDNKISIFGAMRESARIMQGEKWNLFKLQISFIAWFILFFIAVMVIGWIESISVVPNTNSTAIIVALTGISIIIGIILIFSYLFTTVLTFYNFIKIEKNQKELVIFN